MRKVVIVFAALFFLSMSAAAQDSTAESSATLGVASPASETAEPAAPASLSPADREAWQIGAGFEYLHFKSLGVTFNDYGYHTAFTRFFTDRLAAEATLYSGFGHTNNASPNFTAKSIFVGAGPHYAFITAGRFEPWVHAIPGFQHFRFTQNATVGSNNGFGFLGGGGVDYKFGGRAYLRFQADYVGTRVGGQFTSNYAFGTGILFNF